MVENDQERLACNVGRGSHDNDDSPLRSDGDIDSASDQDSVSGDSSCYLSSDFASDYSSDGDSVDFEGGGPDDDCDAEHDRKSSVSRCTGVSRPSHYSCVWGSLWFRSHVSCACVSVFIRKCSNPYSILSLLSLANLFTGVNPKNCGVEVTLLTLYPVPQGDDGSITSERPGTCTCSRQS